MLPVPRANPAPLVEYGIRRGWDVLRLEADSLGLLVWTDRVWLWQNGFGGYGGFWIGLWLWKGRIVRERGRVE